MFIRSLIGFAKDDSGTTVIEYALIAMLVSIAAIAVMTAVGGSINDMLVMVDNGVNLAAEQMVETISQTNSK